MPTPTEKPAAEALADPAKNDGEKKKKKRKKLAQVENMDLRIGDPISRDEAEEQVKKKEKR